MAYFYDVYSTIGTTFVSFEDFCRYQKIEPGTSAYNSLKSAYAAGDAQGFNQLVDYYGFKEWLNLNESKGTAQRAIDVANKKYQNYPQVKQAISDWLSEPGVSYQLNSKGKITTLILNRGSYDTKGITSGGSYWEGVSPNVAISADIVDNKLVLSDKIPYAEPVEGGPTSVQTFAGNITSALAAVATVSMLCKKIDATFYVNAKEYWGIDMYQHDPDWWDAQYASDQLTGFKAFVAQELLAIDPVTNRFALYIDDDFAAGVATYLNAKGWFDITGDNSVSDDVSHVSINYPVHSFKKMQLLYEYTEKDMIGISHRMSLAVNLVVNKSGKLIVFRYGEAQKEYTIHYISKVDDGNGAVTADEFEYRESMFKNQVVSKTHRPSVATRWEFKLTVNDKPVYISNVLYSSVRIRNHVTPELVNDWETIWAGMTTQNQGDKAVVYGNAAYIALYGTDNISNPLPEGASSQTSGNAIGTSKKDIPVTRMKQILEVNYPEIWASAIVRGIPQLDGTIEKKTYIKVPIPSGTNITDIFPTTGEGTQDKTETDIDDLPSGSQSQLPSTVSKPNTSIPTPDATDTGTLPTPNLPIGYASSMWAIYNPKQLEVDSFGSWMWSDNIFEQIKKLFADPMQAIIGIHKVFGAPSIGGRKNIKVGYLDSGVSSNWVNDQYTTVDCGDVNLDEYFGCVYDYAPYTSVNLYLPFVGVVQLDVADVMRSTINVTYGIDVLTGDCLAKVSVSRDGVGGILYSYPGNCAVKYPVSSGSYLGIIGLAAGAIGAAVTGNMGLLAAGASGGFTKVQHGGSFIGNSGATGPRTPYLIISRPQPAYASGFNSIEGYPVNTTVQIGLCKGFIRVKECHLSNINATDDELDMIDQILKDGIIVQS